MKSIPVIHVEGGSLASAYEGALLALFNKGIRIKTQYDKPGDPESIDATMNIIQKNPEFRTRLWEVAKKLQNGLRELGFYLGDIASPITPVYVPAEPEVAMTIIKYLREQKGIFVSGVMYPVVPKGIILLRMIPTAAHTDEQIEKTLSAFKDLRDDFKLHLENVNL